MEPMNKTDELVELLKKLYNNEYAGVSGYLQGVLSSIEKEFPQVKESLEYFMKQVQQEINPQ